MYSLQSWHLCTQAEVESSHKLLIALGHAHPTFIVGYIRDGLPLTSLCSDSQRALLLRALAALAEAKIIIGKEMQESLWPLISQLLHGNQECPLFFAAESIISNLESRCLGWQVVRCVWHQHGLMQHVSDMIGVLCREGLYDTRPELKKSWGLLLLQICWSNVRYHLRRRSQQGL